MSKIDNGSVSNLTCHNIMPSRHPHIWLNMGNHLSSPMYILTSLNVNRQVGSGISQLTFQDRVRLEELSPLQAGGEWYQSAYLPGQGSLDWRSCLLYRQVGSGISQLTFQDRVRLEELSPLQAGGEWYQSAYLPGQG